MGSLLNGVQNTPYPSLPQQFMCLQKQWGCCSWYWNTPLCWVRTSLAENPCAFVMSHTWPLRCCLHLSVMCCPTWKSRIFCIDSHAFQKYTKLSAWNHKCRSWEEHTQTQTHTHTHTHTLHPLLLSPRAPKLHDQIHQPPRSHFLPTRSPQSANPFRTQRYPDNTGKRAPTYPGLISVRVAY